MTKGKLSAAERERLVASSLREKERKQVAYRKAKAVLQQRGLAKIEKSVPVANVEDIRRMAAELVEFHACGMQLEIRIVTVLEEAAPFEVTSPVEIAPSISDVPGPVVRGLGAKRRKHGQNERYRERKRAKGFKRLAFTVPASAADWLSAMISQIIFGYTNAMLPIIEVSGKRMANPVSPASASQIPPALSQDWTLGKPRPASSETSEQSALFDDIQAFVWLMKRQEDPTTGFAAKEGDPLL
jgi:hypothetical protein